MTGTTAPASPGIAAVATVAPAAASVITDVEKAIADAGGDFDTALAKVKTLVNDAETSPAVGAFKSFVGSIWKSGRGGCLLGLVGAFFVSLFCATTSPVLILGAIVALMVTAPNLWAFLGAKTASGYARWELALAVVVVAGAGAGLMWAITNGGLGLLSNLAGKL